ncbi:hypothetical protein [Streptomyces purpureus]|uniref:Uncharacterized protein n=1 Tax=Streptomyces purpureus TaxID=1951 RepID=A0A918H1X0_9ACTN|nr:hypothetical protein [Streptomyces purpureus]GGT31178.1 hypothetical protein GCM10014713_25770 [Streptomyces purpureus]
MFATAEVVRPVWAGSVCVLAVGHDGPHRDRAGDAWWVTPEIADAVSASLLARALTPTPEPEFRSPRCIVGRHDRCRDGVPRETDVPEVRLLVCTCPCHGLNAADAVPRQAQ